MAGPGLASVHDGQLLQTLLFLSPSDANSARATSRSGPLAKAAASDVLWSSHAARALGPAVAASRRGPDGEDTGGSWQRTFALWHAAARQVGLRGTATGEQLPAARWLAVWSRLRRWLSRNAPGVERTLRPPVPASVLAALAAHDLAPAPAVLGLWQVFDGQEAPMEPGRGLAEELGMPALDEDGEWWHGLFGGYAAYDHDVSTLLLPLQAALTLTLLLRRSLPDLRERHPTKLAFACSYNFNKIFFVDVREGTVHAWTRRPAPMLESAAPTSSAAASARAGGEVEPLPAEGLLLWVEEYTRRLVDGTYVQAPLRPEMAPATVGICLLPAKGPELTQCVTRGVEVTGSCVYMPEHPAGWTYSITLRLVGSKEERGFDTCQLHTRHWEIEEPGRETEHVRGEGVVGLFPVLTDGGWLLNHESDPHGQYGGREEFMPGPFRYQSCSGRKASMRGRFGGDITLVPGTLRRPTGPPFQVRLVPFELFVPQYIY